MWWSKTRAGSGGPPKGARLETVPDAQVVRPRAPASLASEPIAAEVVLFTYVDGVLVEVRSRAEVDTVDGTILRALELANAEWTEAEAAAELSRVTGGSVTVLDGACRQLVCALALNPVTDIRGIRATRIVLAALRRPSPRIAGPVQRDGCAPWAWPTDEWGTTS